NFTMDQTVPFAELMIDLQIKSTNDQTIACTRILLEQNMDTVNTVVSYLPLAVALYSGAVSLTSIVMRAMTGNGFMSALATYGLASTSEIISVHTPGFFDIIFYTQFMVMSGQLTISYPSFYVTFTSLFHWSFLEFRNSFAGNGPENSTYVLSYGGAGSVNQIDKPQDDTSSTLQKRLLLGPWHNEPSPSSAMTTSSTDLKSGWPSATLMSFSDSHLLKRDIPIGIQLSPITLPPTPTSSTSGTTSDSSSSTSVSSSTSSVSTETSTKSKPKPTTTIPLSSTTSSSSTTTTTPVVPSVTVPAIGQGVVFKAYNISHYGMASYAAAIGAYPSNLFLCTLINTVLAGGASLFLSVFILVIAWLVAKESHQKDKTLQHAFNFVAGNLLRVWSLFYTPLALSAMYQITLTGNTTMTVIASLSLLVFSVGVTILVTWRILRASTQFLLFEDQETLLKFGALYNILAEEGTLFFLVNLLARFLWGMSVAMLSSYGVAQVSVLLAVELCYLLVIGFKWPFSESGDNKFHILLGFAKIVILGCSVAYLDGLQVSIQVRQYFGYAQMALHLAVFIVMFALVLWNTIQVILFWKSRHTSSWIGAAKNYNLSDRADVDTDWTLESRPISRIAEPAPLRPTNSRLYTVQPYSSIGDLNALSDDNLIGHHSMYHQSHQPPSYQRPRFPSDGDPNLAMDLRSEATLPLSNSTEPMSAQSATSLQRPPSVDSTDGHAIPLQPTHLSSRRFEPPRESYAKIQRMTHQQTTPDLRTRRMSEIFRDGGYLYEPTEVVDPISAKTEEEKQSVIKSIKGSFVGLGSLLSLGKRAHNKPSSDGAKPKAFEVIRPPRPSTVMDTADNVSQAGDDNLRELNSVGINRFFEESGLNNERSRNLFIANPEVVISRAGSVRSSVSGLPYAPPELVRQASMATSIHTISRQLSKPALTTSTDMNSLHSGIGSMASEAGNTESKGVPITNAYPRASADNNIAEVLRSDTPFMLQGGGILKVSKGPEKAVQYWRKESGQYVESTSVDSLAERKQATIIPRASPPILILPSTRGFFDNIQIDTNKTPAAPSIKSRAESRPESPTESHQSTNVVASADKMHEILDRMFSDQDDDDSDTISDDDESCSTFSGRVSATIMALQQKRDQEELFADAQSLYRSETLEPVLEHLDSEADVKDSEMDITPDVRKIPYKPTRTLSGTLIKTYSGSSKLGTSAPSPSTLLSRSRNGSSSRPLAQTPLHSPSVLSFSGSTTSLLLPGTLSRQSSRASLSEGAAMINHEHDAKMIIQPGDSHDTKVLNPLREEPVAASEI
ncbi:hypothetical protein BGZ49_003474, partial [Haplosporangium sp. Z 27]